MPDAGLAITTQGAAPIEAMWVKASTGSKGCFSNANGPMEMGVEFVTRHNGDFNRGLHSKECAVKHQLLG